MELEKESEHDMSKPTGIRERILAATSQDEINTLLRELRDYNWASAKTIAACHNAARRRGQQLQKERAK